MPTSQTVLLTGNLTYAEPYRRAIEEAGLKPEKVEIMRIEQEADSADLKQALREHNIENMVYSRAEHVRMLLAITDNESTEIMKKDVIHFVQDEQSFQILNDAGFPVLQSPGRNSIDMVEYFLRLNRTGPVLTPCVDPESEEIPEFLAELKYESRYLRLYRTEPFAKEELEDVRAGFYQNKYGQAYVLLHEPGTLTQFLVAFPDAPLEDFTFIPLHKTTEQRLNHLGLNSTPLIPWHPDHTSTFVEQLREAVS